MSPRRLLVMGSDRAVHEAVASALAGRDWEIHDAYGPDGWSQARRGNYPVAVIGQNGSKPDAVDLLARMRREQPELRGIVLDAGTGAANVVRAMRRQAFSMFGMPANASALADMLSLAAEAEGWQDEIELISGRPEWVTLRVRCGLRAAERLVQFIRELSADLPDGHSEDVVTAFRELLLNSIEHGCGLDPGKHMRVSRVRLSSAVLYQIKDPGKGFSLEKLDHAAVGNPPEDPVHHIEVRTERGFRPGGFGILLARKLVDELVYNEKGNEVVFLKYLR
jgi:anti-sigma regulatory factor (Ser/Thr protein kinase)/ActR/RegA family two-component response regulator